MKSYNQRIIAWLQANHIRYKKRFITGPTGNPIKEFRFIISISDCVIVRFSKRLEIRMIGPEGLSRYTANFKLQPSLNIEFELDIAYAEYLGK